MPIGARLLALFIVQIVLYTIEYVSGKQHFLQLLYSEQMHQQREYSGPVPCSSLPTPHPPPHTHAHDIHRSDYSKEV